MSFKHNAAFLIKDITSKWLVFSKIHWFLENVILSVATVFITEILSRRNFFEALKFMILSFPAAFMSIMIVLSLLMIPFAFKKSLYWKYFICAFWISLSIISCIMFSFRKMPFNFTDILLIPSTFNILPVYLSLWQMILIISVIVFVIYALVVIYRKTLKQKSNIKKSISMFALLMAVTFSYYFIATSTKIIDNRIEGLINKYNYNGFVYCFTSSAIDKGMREPDDYSASEVTNIIKDINSSNHNKAKNANIIFLQLESFFDVNKMNNISFSQNPIPVYTNLLNSYSHGILNVPTFSSGTANTEFEVITGMNTDFFGIGEYPYQTIAKDSPIESVAFCADELGLKTHAVHNNSATFYDRNIVYPNLGFDTFTSVEYMYDMEYNHLGWAKDMGLVSVISDCLDSSKEKDLIYAVGVQTHGTYPTTAFESKNKITVSGVENESKKNSIEYYINELKEVDEFLGALISDLKVRNEPTVLVIFGDHMPGVEVYNNYIDNSEKYQTEYVLWSNFDTDLVIKNLEAYQLYSYVFDRLNIDGGNISKLHQKYSFRENDEYLSAFELLQYDMIYGEAIGTDGRQYKPTNLKMGIKPIKLEKVNAFVDKVYVHGHNFNQFSHVFVNNKKVQTEFINSKNLVISQNDVKKGDVIVVSQVDVNGNVLSSTNEYLY